jgi:predicted dehydrogenase|tara:strand:- start:164 stop:1252 length:1089 start_codon:yes stop_codon:yes gene_type:complete
MNSNNNFDLDYKIQKPKNYKKYNIGIIGAGNIVENSHLPAYLDNNLNIINIFDINEAKSKYLKEKFNIEKYSSNLEEFLQDKDIHIVDIAVPAKYNKELFFETLKFNKNILIQKPLADNLETGLDILRKYKELNLKASVNHQMRYSPAIRAAGYLIKNNMLGKVLEFNFFTKRKTDWSKWPWLEKLDYPELWYNSIHYIDSIRYLFGEPHKINAKLLKHPNSNLNKPTRTYIDFEYADDLQGNLNISHDSFLKSDKWTAGFEIEGDRGICSGRISSMIGDGKNFKDNISFTSSNSNQLIEVNKELEGRWFPDSFIGPMYSLMDAIDNNTQPETNITDAFKTLKLLNLIEHSHESEKKVLCSS